VKFVTVAPNVQLETLDWGGRGKAIVLLAGGGNTAHVFDEFATKLTRAAITSTALPVGVPRRPVFLRMAIPGISWETTSWRRWMPCS
jgi:hypothetical protein